MQGIGNRKVVPQKLMQGRVFVDPDDLTDRHDRHTIIGRFNKIMLRDEHIFRGKLWQGCQFFLGFR